VLIGGVAGVLLGSTRVTLDVDVLIDCERDNLVNLLAALQEIDAKLLMEVQPGRVEGVAVPSLRVLQSMHRHNWTTRFGDLDTHCSVAGFESYEKVAEVAWPVEIGGASVRVVPLSVLIEMKEAAGRTKDQLALVELYQLRSLGVDRGDDRS
jgi:hypothetical protein